MKLDSDLIKQFREKVNEDVVISQLRHNTDEKNYWGLVCSAMDWISVGIDGVDTSNLLFEPSNEASRRLMAFITYIDVIWESIQQLHRVFTDGDEIPFSNDYSIFHKEETDNKYFKELRAMFMAHPMNLNGDSKNEKWFASWSTTSYTSEGEFSVILYSNNPTEEPREDYISVYKVMKFIDKRYNLLNDYMAKIEKITTGEIKLNTV